MSRDRDAEGRPRQARPRDALGRPLPYGTPGVEPVSEEPLPPMETLQTARELLADGRAFAAHEVLEARWKAGPARERDLWQGLAQLCVGLTHAARGNDVGAARLVERGAERIVRYGAGAGPDYGLDLPAVIACARDRIAGADNVDAELPEPMSFRVDGELFTARADPNQIGAWHLDWLSGPNPGYGFTVGRSDHKWGSRAELENAARDFLRNVDPETGFLQ